MVAVALLPCRQTTHACVGGIACTDKVYAAASPDKETIAPGAGKNAINTIRDQCPDTNLFRR